MSAGSLTATAASRAVPDNWTESAETVNGRIEFNVTLSDGKE